jgi:hypothetical protein
LLVALALLPPFFTCACCLFGALVLRTVAGTYRYSGIAQTSRLPPLIRTAPLGFAAACGVYFLGTFQPDIWCLLFLNLRWWTFRVW